MLSYILTKVLMQGQESTMVSSKSTERSRVPAQKENTHSICIYGCNHVH